jgi:predicted DCC family thiol-disulfide oxidoreductase YuxK
MSALPPPSSLIVLFDGGCPICRRTVRTLRRLDWLDRLQFADATDRSTRDRVAPGLTDVEAMQQMYVVDGAGRRAGGYDAQLRIAREVPLLWPFRLVGGLPGIRQIGLAVYRLVAANRQRRGQCSDDLCSPAFRSPHPSPPDRGALSTVEGQGPGLRPQD